MLWKIKLNWNVLFFLEHLDQSHQPHHPATSVSLVVSVPLPSGVNLSSNTTTAPIPPHHQISNIKSFANTDISPVIFIFTWFTVILCLFLVFDSFNFCVISSIFLFLCAPVCACVCKQNQHLNRSHNLPNVIVQQPAELQVRDPLLLSDKQTLVPGGAIVRNPSPSQSGIKLPPSIGKGKSNTGNSSLFSELNTANNPSNMETLGVKLSAKTAHLADDVSLSRITR